MFTRRLILGTAFSAGALALAGAAHAQDWKAKYPELVMAVVPAENASGVTERYAPFVEYLSKELGTKVTLRVANDYAAVIEGQRNGSIQIAGYGPASYARAVVTGVKVEPFCHHREQRRHDRLLLGLLRTQPTAPTSRSRTSRARTWAWSIPTRPRATTCRASS